MSQIMLFIVDPNPVNKICIMEGSFFAYFRKKEPLQNPTRQKPLFRAWGVKWPLVNTLFVYVGTRIHKTRKCFVPYTIPQLCNVESYIHDGIRTCGCSVVSRFGAGGGRFA